MATQITFVGGERIGVREELDDVVGMAKGEVPSSAGASLARLTREDGTTVYINAMNVLYVRTLDL